MAAIFDNHVAWQPVIDILTDSAFDLSAPRPPGAYALTHALTSLRATCRAARAMIPAPTHFRPTTLLYEAAKVGSLLTCQLANEAIKGEQHNQFMKRFNARVRTRRHIEHSRYREESVEDAFWIAAQNKHTKIADFIWDLPYNGMFNLHYDYLYQKERIKKEAERGELDKCIVLLERADADLVHYMAQGAAKERRMNIIAWMEERKVLSYSGMFAGAASRGHIDLCEMALASGDLNMHYIAYQAGKFAIPEIYELVRDFALRTESLETFYTSVMTACVCYIHEDALRRLHDWAIADRIQPNYELILVDAIEHMWNKQHEKFGNDQQHMCNIIREFCQADGERIDYDNILHHLTDKITYALVVKQWADDENAATMDIHDFYDRYDS